MYESLFYGEAQERIINELSPLAMDNGKLLGNFLCDR